MKMFLLRPSDCFRPFATNKFGGEGKMYEEQPGRWFLDHKQMLALLRRLIKHMSVIKTTKNLIDLISSSKKSIKISGWGKFSAWDMYAFFDGGSFHFKSKYRVCHSTNDWCRYRDAVRLLSEVLFWLCLVMRGGRDLMPFCSNTCSHMVAKTHWLHFSDPEATSMFYTVCGLCRAL